VRGANPTQDRTIDTVHRSQPRPIADLTRAGFGNVARVSIEIVASSGEVEASAQALHACVAALSVYRIRLQHHGSVNAVTSPISSRGSYKCFLVVARFENLYSVASKAVWTCAGLVAVRRTLGGA
jgi:hypothetical protein